MVRVVPKIAVSILVFALVASVGVMGATDTAGAVPVQPGGSTCDTGLNRFTQVYTNCTGWAYKVEVTYLAPSFGGANAGGGLKAWCVPPGKSSVATSLGYTANAVSHPDVGCTLGPNGSATQTTSPLY